MAKDPTKMKEMADKMQKRVDDGQRQLEMLEKAAAKDREAAEKKKTAGEEGEDEKKPAAKEEDNDEKPAAVPLC